MSDADQFRHKSNELLKRAARTKNLGENAKLLDESMLWFNRALAAERAGRTGNLPA